MTLSMAELQRLIRDPQTPESEIRQYFKANPENSRPFAPAVIPDPAKVEVATPDNMVEAAILSDWANDLSRLRRQTIFRARMARGDARPVLVSEGDSWFQFPFLLEDVIDHLGAGFNVWSVDAAGDTLQRMVLDQAEYMDALRANAVTARAFLFSGAGNDIIGRDRNDEPVLANILRPFEPGRPAEWYLETEELAKQLRFIESCYRDVLTNVAAAFPALPVICHGYDYAIPGGFPGDPRHPVWASQDRWLGQALSGLRIHEPALQRQIIKLLIDRLNDRIKSLCGGNVENGAFRTAWHVDVRGTVNAVGLWADELHPTDDGFARVAAKFTSVLRAAISAQGTPGLEAVASARNLYDLTGTWGHAAREAPSGTRAPAGRPQAQAFAFASEWVYLVADLAGRPVMGADEVDSGFATEAVRLLGRTFPGQSLMIGLDGDIFKPAEAAEEVEEKRRELAAFEAFIADLRGKGVALTIHLEAIAGATGAKWERGKAKQLIAAAKSAGLLALAGAPKLISAGRGNVRLSAELKALAERWDKGGYFWRHLVAELRDFKSRGFIAAEIGNLEQALGGGETTAFDHSDVGLSGRLGFYRAYADEHAKDAIPMLMLKNIDAETFGEIEARLGKLGATDDPDRLPRAMFADFHIFEASGISPDARDAIATASARIGIQTLFSEGPDRYRVHGSFGPEAMAGLAAVTAAPAVPAGPSTEAAPMAEVSSALTLTAAQRRVCERVINVFETGTIRGKYDAISIFHDGPHRIRQITYGRAQTTEYGNLAELVQMYVDAGGRFAAELRPFVPRIGNDALVDNNTFKQLLRSAGSADPVMAKTQDVFFETRYFQPAKRWAQENGFTRALSMLVIYDSLIHSGSILPFLRRRFPEPVPARGGNEKEWIRQYVEVRHAWLRTHSNPELRPTIYRTRDLAREIAGGNWDLAQLPISANGTPVDDRPDPAPQSVRAPEAARDALEAARPDVAGPQASGDYEWRGLDKAAFLRRNRRRLQEGIEAVNATLRQTYGAGIVPLTEQDVWVLTCIEAGLTGGKVDPDFEHSEGERGMLPLPSNVSFWNGPGAPAPDRPMPIETNLHHFYLYLGHLMNKKVRVTQGFSLYEGLFRWGSFHDDPVRKVQLLAGVVHGYFLSANYRDRRVPFQHLLEGFDRGQRADEVMRSTRYVHAGSSLMANRARNIAEALALLTAAGPAGLNGTLERRQSDGGEAFQMPGIARLDRAESEGTARSRAKRYKLKFRDKEALQAAASGPETASLPAGRIDWKRDMIVVDGAGEDAAAFDDRTAKIAQDYAAEIVPDQQYEIDDLYEPGPESETDPTLEDVIQMIRADRVWGRSRGAGVTIAVIDTGVEGSRPEFRNKVDWHRGLTAHSNLSAWEDANGHGTMCAAIAAGQGGVGTARSGVAPDARILPCRTTTFFDSDIVRFYDELIERAADGEVIVTTNSFGLKTGIEPPLIDRDLIDVLMKAEAAGIHIFFSAGNNHEETGAAHTACTPNSIWLHKSFDCLTTVGTCDLNGAMWSYSSRGPGQFFGEPQTRQMPDCVAPTPRNGRIVYGAGDRTLTRGWGTSGASPQVAGLAALILALEPRLRPDEVRELIRSTANSFGGFGATCQGKGMVDCEAAVNRVARQPRSRRKEVTLESQPSI